MLRAFYSRGLSFCRLSCPFYNLSTKHAQIHLVPHAPSYFVNAKLSTHTESQQPMGRPLRDGDEMTEQDVLYKKVVLTVKGYDPAVLNSYETFVRSVCGHLALNFSCSTRHRPTFLRLSLNKSPFIHKKHQRQYEFRTHYKYFTIDKVTGCTADVFLEYIQRNLPEGVAMEVTRHRIEKLPEALQPAS